MDQDYLQDNTEDIFNDSIAFLGGTPVVDCEIITYGPISLTIAPKVCP